MTHYLYLGYLKWDPNVTTLLRKATTRDEIHRKPAMRKRSWLRDTMVLGVKTRPQPLLFLYIYIFWMLEKEWLSNSNYHSLYLSRYESMQRPPSLIFGHVCEVESVCRGLIERFLVCVAPIQHFQLYKRTQRKIGSLSHQTTQHKHDLWPNQEAFYYITTCH